MKVRELVKLLRALPHQGAEVCMVSEREPIDPSGPAAVCKDVIKDSVGGATTGEAPEHVAYLYTKGAAKHTHGTPESEILKTRAQEKA